MGRFLWITYTGLDLLSSSCLSFSVSLLATRSRAKTQQPKLWVNIWRSFLHVAFLDAFLGWRCVLTFAAQNNCPPTAHIFSVCFSINKLLNRHGTKPGTVWLSERFDPKRRRCEPEFAWLSFVSSLFFLSLQPRRASHGLQTPNASPATPTVPVAFSLRLSGQHP
jgi:hypothetical protein